MRKETCELCGRKIELGFIEKNHIIPTEVTEEAGMPESKAVRLCSNCHRELRRWYSTKVTDVAYAPETRRFRTKSWTERVKEYESAYDSFIKYKRKQKRAT